MSSPVLIGRSQELAQLDAAHQRAAAGRSAVVLIAGEAGVGKSRLVGEFAGLAERSGARVLVGGCVALDEGGLPWAPVVDSLRGLVRSVEPAELDALLGVARDEVGRLLPELGHPRAEPSPDSAAAQARLLELLLDLFGRLGSEAPLVLVLEDLHWADRASRDLVAFLARRLRDERLLLVLTYRSDDLGRGHPLRPLLAELGRSERVDRVGLRPFERAELSALLDAILQTPAPAELADDIFVRSDGNPFYAEELLAAWRRSEHPGLPGSLRDTLLTRVERLSGQAQAVVAAAAAAGRRVDHRLIAAVAGLTEPQFADAVRETVAEQVLLADPDGRGLAFRHALMREAALAELLPVERVRLHAGLATAITAHRDWTYGTEATVAAELAYHWDAALDAERALPAAVRAGLAAEQVYAFANAACHFERAAALWDRVADAAALAGLDRAGVLAHAAEAVHHTNVPARAVALQRAAVAALDGEAEPVRAALLQERLGRFLWLAGDPGALAAYADAVGMLADAPPSAERARILAAHAQALMLVSQAQQAREVAEQACAMARAVGAGLEEGRAEATLGAALHALGDPWAGVAHLHRARAVALQQADIDGIGWSWINQVYAVATTGQLTDALALALEGSEVMQRLGTANTYGDYLHGFAGQLEFRLGRWADADRRSRELVQRDQATSVKGIFLRLWRARLLIARGDLPEAHLLLDQTEAHVTRSQAPHLGEIRAFALAELALAEGRHADAAVAAGDGILLTSGAQPRGRVTLAALGLRALAEQAAALRTRKAPEAVKTLQEIGSRGDDLLAGAQEAGAARPPGKSVPEPTAWLRQCHAEHARLHGRPDPAAWAEVAAGWDQLAEPYPAAYAHWRRAEALLSTRVTRTEAAAPLRVAAQLAQHIGARPLLTEITRLARRARIQLVPPKETPPAADAAPFGLTRRELEVLAHLTAGHTNREIAKALFVAEKTASFHVSGILSKLGASTRSEAAALAHRLGLLGDAGATSR
ncbi:LuxR family transcriptional regulator [Rhizocola hellebori]|uniref:LuxR family transcriptional regulator n=1 Tax=Rhizocola hellebori TaxID=1392758 RepID=A0A8J3Q1V0_9ACTN|nr:LuxR family transcriptional regulator [Rhizocola hellebori]